MKLKNIKMELINVRFGVPSTPKHSFGVFVLLRYKDETVGDITIEKDITTIYKKFFGSIRSQKTKNALLKAGKGRGIPTEMLFSKTDLVCFGEAKVAYDAIFKKGSFDPWLERAEKIAFA